MSRVVLRKLTGEPEVESQALYLTSCEGQPPAVNAENTIVRQFAPYQLNRARKREEYRFLRITCRSYEGLTVDAYGAKCRRRTWDTAKSLGEPCTGVDPGMSEWGNPLRRTRSISYLNT